MVEGMIVVNLQLSLVPFQCRVHSINWESVPVGYRGGGGVRG